LLGFLAIVTPGTGLLEVGALFCVVLAGYAIYNLSVNWWALLLLLISIVPFLYAVRKPKRELYLGVSIFLLVIGSVFLFAVDGFKPAVNPWLPCYLQAWYLHSFGSLSASRCRRHLYAQRMILKGWWERWAKRAQKSMMMGAYS
jgi:membrane-bound ClpP family serine protease